MRLNFYKYKHRSSYNIENIFFSIMATDISIGSPEYKISLQISTDTSYFLVKGSNSPNEYKQENSSSFYFTKYGHSYEYKNNYFHSIFFDENFKINNKLIKLNSMMYWEKYPITYTFGIIGLQLLDRKFNENNIFINQLYNKGIIKNKIFSLIYENDEKGELFIGDYPHNKSNILEGKEFKICYNSFIKNGDIYGIIFDEIRFRERYFIFKNLEIKNTNYLAIFSNTYNGYIGSKEYNTFISETFFKDKLISKKCWIQNIDNDKFYGYVCIKSVIQQAFQISNFIMMDLIISSKLKIKKCG